MMTGCGHGSTWPLLKPPAEAISKEQFFPAVFAASPLQGRQLPVLSPNRLIVFKIKVSALFKGMLYNVESL